MLTLRDRFRVVLDGWHSADEFSPNELEDYLDALEDSVKDWLADAASKL